MWVIEGPAVIYVGECFAYVLLEFYRRTSHYKSVINHGETNHITTSEQRKLVRVCVCRIYIQICIVLLYREDFMLCKEGLCFLSCCP